MLVLRIVDLLMMLGCGGMVMCMVSMMLVIGSLNLIGLSFVIFEKVNMMGMRMMKLVLKNIGIVRMLVVMMSVMLICFGFSYLVKCLVSDFVLLESLMILLSMELRVMSMVIELSVLLILVMIVWMMLSCLGVLLLVGMVVSGRLVVMLMRIDIRMRV